MSYKYRSKFTRDPFRHKQTVLENKRWFKDYGVRNVKEKRKAMKVLEDSMKVLKSCDEGKIRKQEEYLRRVGIIAYEEVLSNITVEKVLQRRLQSVVKDKFKLSLGESRQKISHRKVLVGYKYQSSPTRLITLQEEVTLTVI